jgi:hypothetical protein
MKTFNQQYNEDILKYEKFINFLKEYFVEHKDKDGKNPYHVFKYDDKIMLTLTLDGFAIYHNIIIYDKTVSYRNSELIISEFKPIIRKYKIKQLKNG